MHTLHNGIQYQNKKLRLSSVLHMDHRSSHGVKTESDKIKYITSWKKILKTLLITTFVLSSTSAFASWNLKREYGDTIIYSSPNSTRLTLSYRTTAPKDKKFSKDLLNRLEKDKRELLALIGITNWKVTKSDIKKEKKNTYITFEGSYLDNAGKMTYFVEYHFYASDKTLQILLTNKNLKKLKKDYKEFDTYDFFVGCTTGLFDSVLSFGDALIGSWDWIVEKGSDPTKSSQEAKAHISSITKYALSEYGTAYGNTSGSKFYRHYNAAVDVASATANKLFTVIEKTLEEEYEQFSCLNFKTRNKTICKLAGEIVGPPLCTTI